MIKIKTYTEPPILQKEILRYAGVRTEEPEILNLMKECLDEVLSLLSYKVCYLETGITIKSPSCDFGLFSLTSSKLARNLEGCTKAIVFAGTIGTQMDRLISRYGRIAPSKAMMLQAIGAERIEALCNCFCKDMSQETGHVLKPRFSPGFGDLPLETQKIIFDILNPAKHIGLTLNNSLLMSPTKSVTAFVGLTK